MVKGSASGCFAASKIIGSLVDELDDCVAQFQLSPRSLRTHLYECVFACFVGRSVGWFG